MTGEVTERNQPQIDRERQHVWSHRQTLMMLSVLVLANLALRFLWLAYMHPKQVDDFAWYFSHATDMYKGLGYEWYGHPTSYWPIGYPFFLSLLFHVSGPSVFAGLAANILLSTGIVVLVYAVTVRVFGNSAIGYLAAVGYTLLPSQIEWNSVLGSEELFTFLLTLSLWVYLRSTEKLWLLPTVVAGVLMGLGADVRPIVLLFPIPLLLYERFATGRSYGSALLVTAVFAASLCAGVAPVTIRNWLALHHFVLVSTNGGVNLWQGTHSNGAYYWSWNRNINPLLPYVKNDYLENKVAIHAALMYYEHHPLRTVLNGFAKWFFLYWADWNVVSVTFAQKLPRVPESVIRFYMWFDSGVYYLWMLVTITGLIQTFKAYASKTVRGHWLLIAYLAYNTAIFFFFPAWDRFRYPMMPLYAVFFGIGAWYIVTRWRRKVTWQM